MKLLKKISLPKGLIVISVIYWLIFILMHPLFGKAYLDDFAYILTTKHLVVDGFFKVSEWTAVSLIAQVFWGALFTSILGFSMKSLIISTVTLFYFGLIAFYFVLKELDLSDFISTLFTLILLAFPWNLLFAYSFMTDIPFMSLFVISLLFYIKGIKRENWKFIFLGSIFAAICYLVRQTAIMLPFSAFILFLAKGVGDGRLFKYGKHIVASILAPFIVFVGYFIWLGTGDNKTFGQIMAFDRGLIYAFKNYFWPQDIYKIGTVSRYYSETVNRVGIYLIQITGLLWPIIFVYSMNVKRLKKLLIWKNLIAYILVFLALIFILFVPPYSKIILSPLSNFYFPQELIYFPTYIGPFDIRGLRDVWDTTIIFSLPFFAILIALFLKTSWSKFFYWKKRISLRFYLTILFASQGAVWLSFYRQLMSLSSKYPAQEIVSETWFFFTTISVVSLLLVTIFYGLRIKKLDIRNSLYFFIVTTFFTVFSWTLILPYVWFEYVISFIPFIVILLALATKSLGASKSRLIMITIALIFMSFVNAKSAHTVLGSVWEGAEILVQEGVDPRNIETFEFAWYPWWYYEKTFEATLESVGGDKYKILKLKTWESVPTNELLYTVQFIKNASLCGVKSRQQMKIDTLFLHGLVCASNENY